MLKMTFINDEDELLQSNNKIPLHKGEPETQTIVSTVISSDQKIDNISVVQWKTFQSLT